MEGAILELSRQLGVAADQLIGWYVVLAPWQWLWVVVDVGFALGCAAMSVLTYRWYQRFEAIGEVLLEVLTMGFAVLSAVGVFAALVDLKVAVEAAVSPHAFAVDQILKALH